MSLQVIYDVPCPFCNQPVGRYCIVATTGRSLPTPHVARRLAFQIAWAARPAAAITSRT